jgi:hypothetical protein
MRALGFAGEAQAPFLPPQASVPGEYDPILYNGNLSGHMQIRHAQRLMSRAQFAEAYQEFRTVFDVAAAHGDVLVEAEAAGWLAWFHGELERFPDCRRWTEVAIGLVESHLGMKVDEVIDSVSGPRCMSASSPHAVHVLSRVLRNYSKVLAVRIVHHTEFSWLSEARRAFEQSLRLDGRLQLDEIAHGLRWRAAALSAEDGSQLKDIEGILSASREHMVPGSPAEACLIREQGIIRWQKGRVEKAREFLLDAKERLTFFADSRALGPTFCVLSKVVIQECGDLRLARRYALIAATLHPYGYVLDHCVDQLRTFSSAERDFDELLDGHGPFEVVHQVMSRVAQGSPNTGAHLVRRDLDLVRAALLGH